MFDITRGSGGWEAQLERDRSMEEGHVEGHVGVMASIKRLASDINEGRLK